MIRVLIADDHTLVREGLKQILSETHDIVITDIAKNGEEVLNKVSEQDFDVILLDISMPNIGGLDVLKQMHAKKPELPIVILSMYPEEQYGLRVLKAGASGYLTKENAPEELIAAIRKVAQGRKFISPYLAEKLLEDIEHKSPAKLHEYLSDREYQVLCMIASGKTLTEIGEELMLSVKTISTYRSRIIEKMGMKNNAELTFYVVKNNLIL